MRSLNWISAKSLMSALGFCPNIVKLNYLCLGFYPPAFGVSAHTPLVGNIPSFNYPSVKLVKCGIKYIVPPPLKMTYYFN